MKLFLYLTPFLLLFAACAPASEPNNNDEANVQVQQEFDGKIVYTMDAQDNTDTYQQHCEDRGGTFNECGSPCAPDAEFCTEVCAYTCEFDSEENNNDTNQNWTTYRNETMGFSIEYPSDMEIERRADGIHVSLVGPTQTENTEFFDGISMIIRTETKETDQTLESFAEQKVEESTITGSIDEPLHPVTIQNRDGFQYVATGLGTHTITMLPGTSPDTVFIISYTAPDPGGEGYEDTAVRILESFETI